jgi:hypothetical protein
MTDKQIIKHNVNVSKCEFLGFPRSSKAYCVCDSSELSDICDENPNCYYKQLKRKEQECEGLKIQIKEHNDDMFKNPPEKRFYCKGCTLPYISKKLSQTLTEIKEIAERGFKHSQCNCGAKADLDLILQKISECEGNDGN